MRAGAKSCERTPLLGDAFLISAMMEGGRAARAARKSRRAGRRRAASRSHASSGWDAVVILSTVTYIDKAMCLSDGLAVDINGNPIGCTNLGKWVFTQRLVIGQSSIHGSNFGSPLVGGSTGVTLDPTTGAISLDDQVKKSGDVAIFSGINPYASTAGVVTGLPSGQVIYIAEASAKGFSMNPIMPNAVQI